MTRKDIYALRYDPQNTDYSELVEAYRTLVKQIGDQYEVIVLPNDLSLEKLSRNDLIEIRHKIGEILHNMMYKKRCQYTEAGAKPCEDMPMNCNECNYYYSDDDARW